MNKIGILTDTSAGFSLEESKILGIELILMPIILDNDEYHDLLDIDNQKLFQLVSKGQKPKTSQPSYGQLKTKFAQMLEIYQDIIYIPISSGLSSTVQTATSIALEFENRVHVLDTKKVSILMRQDVLFAKKLIDEGFNIEYICQETLKRVNQDFAIIVPQNLTYLKLGGRISPLVAAVGNLIGIKPLIKFEDGHLDKFDQARTFKKAYSLMINSFKNSNILPSSYDIWVIFNNPNEESDYFLELVKSHFEGFNINKITLPTNISVHTGPYTIGFAYTQKI